MAGNQVKVQIDPQEINVDLIPFNEPLIQKASRPGTPSGYIDGRPFEQRLDANSEVRQGGSTGIAFSGGGIRSAAFCSGALRRMLQDGVPLEYLSCASGGGYTGAAFLDWKQRAKEGIPDEVWQKRFFEKMRENAGYMCNWQSLVGGICHSFCFIFLLILVVFILPCFLWLTYAFPVAVFVDFFLGGILRENSTCAPSVSEDAKTSYLILELYDDCQPPGRRVALFVFLFAAWVGFFFLSRIKSLIEWQNLLNLFRFLSIISGLFLAMTFFPWVAHDFMWPLKTWIKVLVFMALLVLPFLFPIVQNIAAIFLFFYVYTLVVSWRVFKTDLVGLLPYSDEVFYPILIGCAIAIILFPFFGPLHQSLFNIYYRFVLLCT